MKRWKRIVLYVVVASMYAAGAVIIYDWIEEAFR